MSTALKNDILEANRLFYEVFRSADIERMEQLWARDAEVSVYHPGWSGITGRTAVMASWRQVMVNAIPPEIHPSDVCVILSGEKKAVVFCVEHIGDTAIFASNIFTFDVDAWRLMHLQATPLPIQVF